MRTAHALGCVWSVHAYRYGCTVFVLEIHHNKSVGVPEIWIPSQKFQILSFMKQQTWPFRFFQRVAEAFVPELTQATDGCGAHS